MANTFKNAKSINVGTSLATVYTAPGSSGNVAIILGVAVANKNAAARTVTIEWQDASDSSNATQLLDAVTIPGNSTLEVLAGQKYVLEQSDVVRAKASNTSSIDITVGVMEIT